MYQIQRVFPTNPPVLRYSAARRPANLQGLGFSIGGGISTESIASDLAQKLVDVLWPPVDEKINQTVPVVANTVIDIAKSRMPELIDTAKPKLAEVIDSVLIPKIPKLIDAAKPKIPELMNIAMPIAQKNISALMQSYEARYASLFTSISKYGKPMLVGVAVLGVLVAAASIKTLVSK